MAGNRSCSMVELKLKLKLPISVVIHKICIKHDIHAVNVVLCDNYVHSEFQLPIEHDKHFIDGIIEIWDINKMHNNHDNNSVKILK